MKLDQVRLLVTAFGDCHRFYADVLGLRPTFGSADDTYASFDTGSATALALFDAAEMAAAVGTMGLPATASRRDPFVLVLEVDDVDAAADRARTAGVALVTEPADRPDWGIRTCHLRDPDGNLVELEQPLAHG